jgi:hypothetical protein
MIDENPELVAIRARQALETQCAIDYGSGFTDKEYPEIRWSMCGLPDTNEIAVIASVGHLQLGIAHRSRLEWPAMIDRIFGIDVDDQQLAFWLSEQLWNAHSGPLVAEALRVRAVQRQ